MPRPGASPGVRCCRDIAEGTHLRRKASSCRKPARRRRPPHRAARRPETVACLHPARRRRWGGGRRCCPRVGPRTARGAAVRPSPRPGGGTRGRRSARGACWRCGLTRTRESRPAATGRPVVAFAGQRLRRGDSSQLHLRTVDRFQRREIGHARHVQLVVAQDRSSNSKVSASLAGDLRRGSSALRFRALEGPRPGLATLARYVGSLSSKRWSPAGWPPAGDASSGVPVLVGEFGQRGVPGAAGEGTAAMSAGSRVANHDSTRSDRRSNGSRGKGGDWPPAARCSPAPVGGQRGIVDRARVRQAAVATGRFRRLAGGGGSTSLPEVVNSREPAFRLDGELGDAVLDLKSSARQRSISSREVMPNCRARS